MYCRSPEIDIVKIKHLLIQHRQRVLIGVDNEEYQRIHIRRAYLLKDAFRQFSKDSFAINKLIRVVFIGEEAVDDGGPRREFFHLLNRDIFTKSGLFAGHPHHVVPLHNVNAVENKMFYLVGQMIATILVQGGEPPACFAKAVSDLLIFRDIRSSVCIEDVPDYAIQTSLKQVSRYTIYTYTLCLAHGLI